MNNIEMNPWTLVSTRLHHWFPRTYRPKKYYAVHTHK